MFGEVHGMAAPGGRCMSCGRGVSRGRRGRGFGSFLKNIAAKAAPTLIHHVVNAIGDKVGLSDEHKDMLKQGANMAVNHLTGQGGMISGVGLRKAIHKTAGRMSKGVLHGSPRCLANHILHHM